MSFCFWNNLINNLCRFCIFSLLLSVCICVEHEDIVNLAIDECLVPSKKSLALISCTYTEVSESLVTLVNNLEIKQDVDLCLMSTSFQRTIIGLALSFEIYDEGKFYGINCPRSIAALLRDRILGFSCPNLAKKSDIFRYNLEDYDNNKLFYNTEVDMEHSNRLPTIFTSAYRKLLQSCDRIQVCMELLDLQNEGNNNNAISSPAISNLNISLSHSLTKILDRFKVFLPSIKTQYIREFAQNIFQRCIIEYQNNISRESPLDPFWIIQVYRMVFLYFINLDGIINDLEVINNLVYLTFRYLTDISPLQKINLLQLQTKFIDINKESKKQLLFIRAAYTLSDHCFSFWKYINTEDMLTINTKKQFKNDIDVAPICHQGLQLPLRQSIIFLYYMGIDRHINPGGSHLLSNNTDLSNLSGNTSNYNIYINNSLNNNDNQINNSVPWFLANSNIVYPFTTVKELEQSRLKEIKAIIQQSKPNINNKATVLNLSEENLVKYFVGGSGSMMFKTCTYFLKKQYILDKSILTLAETHQINKDGIISDIVTPLDSIRFFCWNVSVKVYEELNKDFSYEESFSTLSPIQGESQVIPKKTIISPPRPVNYDDIVNLSSPIRSPSVFSANDSGKRKISPEILKRREELLRRMNPKASQSYSHSIVASLDNLPELNIPKIKRYISGKNIIRQNNMVDNSKQLSKKIKKIGAILADSDVAKKHGLVMNELLSKGKKLRMTNSDYANDIRQQFQKQIKDQATAGDISLISSQLFATMEATDFEPPIVDTAILDEVSSDQKLIYEQ
ncbi:uncharacterized protein CMU_039060 [Cryptosporidium muris RN66]|uniref:WH2 domain-containing protein n=1 Tax=Cryptosporidium muris (strain RN66) TaxID=441375 RepID=B6A9E8_CRYMR|nr:uncharacterized protein CMU_039060 [Cryptosporidium muris RN66]EEA04839.1 hypothetical protein, conserved [Cryptosporidium muris RN66]|eukprot:XP_002139188.1 hypothetical protein [Cryptosporidium muris RN66]